MPSGSSAFDGNESAPIIVQALSDQGEAALQDGDLAAAGAALKEAAARWRSLDEPVSLARALNNLGVTYARMRKPKMAVPLLTEAVGLFNAAAKRDGEATALNSLGAVYADMGDYEQAITRLRSALSLRRDVGDRSGEALTLDLLARVSARAGDLLAALGYRREELEAVRATRDGRAEADALVTLAEALFSTGYDAEAVSALETSAGIYEQLGLLKEAGETYLKLAQTYFESGNMAAAVRPLEKGLPLLRQAGAWTLQATQWESFLFGQRMQQQAPEALKQWKRGEPSGMDSLIDSVRDRLAATGSDSGSTLNDQLLQMIANSAARLAAMSPSQRSPALPATDEIAAHDTRSTPDLVDALRSTTAPERRKAALALGMRGDLGAVEPLIETCEDRNQWVRMAAVRSLGKLKDVRALDALCKRVEEDRDKEVRRSAATALGALGDPRAAEALTLALTDSYFRTVESAEKALRKLKAAPDISALIAALKHKDVSRRYGASDRLARLGDRQAVGPLASEAQDAEQPVEVRLAALRALARLKDREGVEAAIGVLESAEETRGAPRTGMEPDARLKRAALTVIATADGSVDFTAVTPRLVACLKDLSPHVRLAAVQALAAVGDERAIPALERIQQSDDGVAPLTSDRGMQQVRLRSAAAEAISLIRNRCG